MMRLQADFGVTKSSCCWPVDGVNLLVREATLNAGFFVPAHLGICMPVVNLSPNPTKR